MWTKEDHIFNSRRDCMYAMHLCTLLEQSNLNWYTWPKQHLGYLQLDVAPFELSHQAKCRYAGCHFAECHYTKCINAQCL
jgi:hypothetical protein